MKLDYRITQCQMIKIKKKFNLKKQWKKYELILINLQNPQSLTRDQDNPT
jgi:hypothetical protein